MSQISYQNRDVNPLATLSDFIWVKDKSLSKSFCKDIIKKFDKSEDKYDGLIGLGFLDKNMKQTKDLGISTAPDSDNSLWQEEDDVLYQALKEGLDEYHTMCNGINQGLTVSPQTFNFHDTGYQIQRYEPGGFYDWHHDWTLHNSSSRLWTYIWYLNTIKKKDEGYTQFIDGTKVQPKVGRLVIFPALWNYLHRGFPSKVRKYICTGWVYGKLSTTLSSGDKFHNT